MRIRDIIDVGHSPCTQEVPPVLFVSPSFQNHQLLTSHQLPPLYWFFPASLPYSPDTPSSVCPENRQAPGPPTPTYASPLFLLSTPSLHLHGHSLAR